MGCTPPKANMSPENNHDFNRKYIWINHWFSGDTRQFSGENKWLGSPAIWKGIPPSPIIRGTKMSINHGFTQSVPFPVGSWPARNQVSRLAPWRFSTKNLAPKKNTYILEGWRKLGWGKTVVSQCRIDLETFGGKELWLSIQKIPFMGRLCIFTYGIQKWRFGRWFSFSNRWFSGSMSIFQGVQFWLMFMVN